MVEILDLDYLSAFSLLVEGVPKGRGRGKRVIFKVGGGGSFCSTPSEPAALVPLLEGTVRSVVLFAYSPCVESCLHARYCLYRRMHFIDQTLSAFSPLAGGPEGGGNCSMSLIYCCSFMLSALKGQRPLAQGKRPQGATPWVCCVFIYQRPERAKAL